MTLNQQQIRVLVVDDSAFIRRAVIRMFDGHPVIRIIDVAADGAMAIDLIKKLRPDVVTLDVKMPVLDGLAALARIMKECPTPVIMLSSLTEKGGENTLKALELGAVDFIDKTAAGGPMDISGLARELTAKILVAARVDVLKLRQEEAKPVAGEMPQVHAAKGTEIVLIGTSTGGPPALQTVLGKIPATFPCPILIVQHMPVGFTASLAERLNRLCAITVKEGVDGEVVQAGCAYLAPGGTHMKLKRNCGRMQIWLDTLPADALHRPSVDVLFESAAQVCGAATVAVVLTGMGKDGAEGAQALKRLGARVVVEAEQTSIVFGMPKAVMTAVAVDGEIPLHNMAEAIVNMI